jgi:hypothetical protein
MDEQATPKEQAIPKLEFKHDEDFTSLYANNISFESSVWDLKMLFGQLDQSQGAGNPVVEQHTAMTVPWPQIKLMAYYLVVNLALHQNQSGNIRVPAGVLPPRPDPSDPALDENGKNLCAYLVWVHNQFFGSDPYIPPGVDATKL